METTDPTQQPAPADTPAPTPAPTDPYPNPAPPAEPDAAPPPQASSVRDDYADWPFGADDDRPQPWDHRALDVDPNAVGPGEPDDVSPVAITHTYPILSAGSAGGAVLELGQLLADLGYENSVSEGRNPFNNLDQSVLSAVQQFRRDHGVIEDPSPFGGDNRQGQEAADNHVGPYTWEALRRVVERGGE